MDVEATVLENIEALSIREEEDDLLMPPEDLETEAVSYDFAFVGTFLTKAVIFLDAMRNQLANYWRPEHGVEISELRENRYLFEFFHEVDLMNVMEGGPYNFNNHLLIFKRLEKGDDPMKVPLLYTTMWVQVHDLPKGSYSEGMAKVLGNFVGQFVEYDAKAVTRGNTGYMRIRIQIDIRLPLKRKKKVSFGRGKEGYVQFRYEKLTLFCFLCGKLGHHDRVCPRRFQPGGKDLPLEWGIELRAGYRRQAPISPFLRFGGVSVSTSKTTVIQGDDAIVTNSVDSLLSNPLFQGGDKGENSNVGLDKENAIPMDHESEDHAAAFLDAHKRARTNPVSDVSNKDPKEASSGPLKAQIPNLSAGLSSKARRSQ